MNSVLLIGGSGMIGTYTTRELLKQGYDVHIADIEPPHVEVADKCTFHEIDIRNGEDLWDLFEGEYQFEAVYYFAAVIRLDECASDPVHAWDINCNGLITALQSSARHHVKRFIFPSTVHLYGHADTGTEDAIIDTGDNLHLYSATKATGEMLVKSYQNHYGLPYTILRYGIAFGPGFNKDLVLHAFVRSAHRKQTLDIRGDGSTTRDFLYVTDHARGNVLALKSEAENQIINFGGRESITLNGLVDIIREEVDPDVRVQYTPARLSDYKGATIHNDKALKLLGWQPEVSLREGISKYYKWVQSL
jgi:UDP-glucose 4-epimerase